MATRLNELAEHRRTSSPDSLRRGPAMPLAALLSTLTGFALLVVFWQARRFLSGLPDIAELAFVTSASFLFVWGLTELAGAIFSRSADSTRQRSPESRTRLGAASWSGIVLVSLGAGGLLIVRRGSPYDFVPVALLLTGAVLILIGAKRFVDRLVRGHDGVATTQRVALTAPGAMCLVISVLLLAGGFLGPSNMLMLVFGMVVGPFIVNGWYAFGMIRRLVLARTSLPQALAGEPVTVTLALSNRKRRLSSWLMTASDTLTRTSEPNAGERLVAETLFSRVPARDHREATYRLRLMRRGRYRFGPVRVRSKFPLGLVERSLTFDLPDELIVAPRLGRLTDRWRREAAAADELVHQRQARRGAFPDEFEKIRLFRYGDNPRLIHWRTSARQNALMVREYHEIRDRDLLMLLDLTADPSDEASLLRVEQAVSFAATACVDQLQRSRQSGLSLAAAGREPANWVGIAHPSSAEPMLRVLALMESAPAPDLRLLWEFAGEQRTPTTAGVLVTTRPAAAIERPAAAGWIRVISVADGGLADLFTVT